MPDWADYGDGALIDNLALGLGPDAGPLLRELRTRLRRLRLLSILRHDPIPVNQYSVERLPNGLVHVRDRATGLTCCFDSRTGWWRHGDLFAGSRLTIYDLGLLTPPDEVTHGPR